VRGGEAVTIDVNSANHDEGLGPFHSLFGLYVAWIDWQIMNGFWLVVLVLAGLLAIGTGLREIRTQSVLRRSGVHTNGVVLRYEATGYDPDSGRNLYSPVIGFRDEGGIDREFRSKMSGGRGRCPTGSPVRVVHLSGRPETARPDTVGYRVAALALSFGVGTVFLLIAVVFGLR
jgi:hypothetical protein